MKKIKYGLVLSGGGTKGAYEVGVLKALKKLNIDISMVSGASIGTINAIFEVQGNVDKLERLYKNINMNDILTIQNGSFNENEKITSIHNLGLIASAMLSGKGVTNESLKKLIEENIDINKLYNSKIKYGFMVYDTKSKKGKEIYLKDIPKEKIVDYIAASACFPIYKPEVIGDKTYMDGGLYDNMPINMLVKKGIKNIIVVDIMGVGVIKRNKNKDVNFIIIKPNESLGGTFDVNKETIDKNIKLGYLDTLKAFHKLQGLNFYFKTNDYSRMLYKYNIETLIGLEKCGIIYKFDKYKIYSFKNFIDILMDMYLERYKIYEKLKTKKMGLSTITKILNKGYGVVLCADLINNYPSLFKNYRGLFENYISSAMAILTILPESKR